MQTGANDTVSPVKSMKTASRFVGWLSTNGGMTLQRKTIAPRGLFNFSTKASVRDDGSEPSTLRRMEKSMPKQKGQSIKAYLTVTGTSSDRCFASERISSYVTSQRNRATWCFI